METGDLIFIEFRPKKLRYKIMAKLQQYFDKTRFHHVGLYLGNNTMSEMWDTGLRRVSLPQETKEVKIEVVPMGVEDKVKFYEAVLKKDNHFEGVKYPTYELIQIGIGKVIKAICGLETPVLIDGEGAVCSAYVWEVYREYGVMLGMNNNLSVGDLYRIAKRGKR